MVMMTVMVMLVFVMLFLLFFFLKPVVGQERTLLDGKRTVKRRLHNGSSKIYTDGWLAMSTMLALIIVVGFALLISWVADG